MRPIKKFFRDLFVAVVAFYLPIIVFTSFYALFGIQEYRWAYLSNSVIPVISSLAVFFWATSSWNEKPSPMVTCFGVWVGGPGSFIAGTYIGFLGGLLFLAFFYPIFSIGRKLRWKFGFGSVLTILLVSLVAAGLTIYIPAATFDAKYPLSKSAYRRQPIHDVTRAETLTLEADPARKKVYRITVYFEGELDGKALVHVANSKDRVKTKEIGPGKFKEEFSSDWDEHVCFLTYEPEVVRSGQVTVYYELWAY